ncbi:MAG: TlpA family protein disulfide reductase [Rhodospirillaceae bacterium]
MTGVKLFRFAYRAFNLALIITALAVVASGLGLDRMPSATAAASEKIEPKDFTWHSTPVDAPKTVFKDANDADKTLKDFGGKVLIVNFWATWCAPCVKEMPSLERLNAKLGGKDFQVIAINQERNGAKVAKPFADKQGWKMPLYLDAATGFYRDAKLGGLPTTLIIGKDGKELGRVAGEVEWDSPAVEKMVRDLLKKA